MYLVFQAENWIEEKLKGAREDDFTNVKDLHDKMKKLKKHQAFEAEIVANTARIRDIKNVSAETVSDTMFTYFYYLTNLL